MDRIVGVDASKARLDAYCLASGRRRAVGNDAHGIAELTDWLDPDSLVVMEAWRPRAPGASASDRARHPGSDHPPRARAPLRQGQWPARQDRPMWTVLGGQVNKSIATAGAAQQSWEDEAAPHSTPRGERERRGVGTLLVPTPPSRHGAQGGSTTPRRGGSAATRRPGRGTGGPSMASISLLTRSSTVASVLALMRGILGSALALGFGSAERRREEIRSGQVRPYVRPAPRLPPLAIMGVRLRVRHQSVRRARSTVGLPVWPELP